MTQATIRPIERANLAAVADMLAHLADHVRPGLKPLADEACLARYGPTGLGLFKGLVALRGGGHVGLCLYTYAFSGWRGRPGLYVQDLYVAPSERGSGLGRALLAAAIGQETANGCSFIRLGVDKANAGAIGFYTRLGFEIDEDDHEMIIAGEALLALG